MTTNNTTQPKEINHNHIFIGTVVRYNGQTDATYVIISTDLANPWNPYRMMDVSDFSITTTDLNQPGWEIIANGGIGVDR